MVITSVFPSELRKKHRVNDAVFLVNYRAVAAGGTGPSRPPIPVLILGNRNSVERVPRGVKRQTSSFSNTFSHAQPETAESWLQAFAVCHNAFM